MVHAQASDAVNVNSDILSTPQYVVKLLSAKKTFKIAVLDLQRSK